MVYGLRLHTKLYTAPSSLCHHPHSSLLLLLLTIAGFGLVSLSRTKPTFKTFPSFYFISCAPEIRSDFVCFRLSFSLSLSLSISLAVSCSLVLALFSFFVYFFSFLEKQLRHFAFNLAVFRLTVATASATATIAQWSKAKKIFEIFLKVLYNITSSE